MPESWQLLLNEAARLPLESMLLSQATDDRKRLRRTFDPAFPFEMHAYCFPDCTPNLEQRWLNSHDYLELIIPTSGSGRFCMGSHTMEFAPGDLLVVENMKLHGVIESVGEHQSLVVFFQPELVFHPGSAPCDYDFLSPFFGRQPTELPLLTRDAPTAAPIHRALIELLDAYLGPRDAATCKLRLLNLLNLLNELRHCFGARNLSERHYKQRQRCVQGLLPVLNRLREHFAEPLCLDDAAAQAGMSRTLFKNCFKEVTGTTFTRYRIHLRLSKAAQLLSDGDLSIGDVAQTVGFSDQSYFDRRFRERFGRTPREYRLD